ncbi:hypothetical protein GZH53_08615 [Flavihumibacter sp. R14]|nr:hypothetical protein [Flavihumibacter soli]
MKSNAVAWIFMLLIFAACNTSERKAASENTFEHIEKHFDLGWADSSYWDDGKAEVAVYNASRRIYKKDRSFEATLVTVAEEFNIRSNVKTDDYSRKDLFRVIKYHAFARIPTDNYPYHFSTSIFLKRENPLSLHKMTSSSQEWCGNTFKEFNNKGGSLSLQFSSYWDNEGSGSRELEPDALFEDQLGYTLRSLRFKSGLRFQAKVLNTQVSNKVGTPAYYNADFAVSESDSTFILTVSLDKNKENRYEFRKAYPNILIRQTTWDGRNLSILKVSRYAYWQN